MMRTFFALALAGALLALPPAVAAGYDYEDMEGLRSGGGYAYGAGAASRYESTERYYDYMEERTDELDDTYLVSEATEDYYNELEEEADEYEAAGYEYLPHLRYDRYYAEDELFLD